MVISKLVVTRKLVVALLLSTPFFVASSNTANATVQFDSAQQQWSLKTGKVEYVLSQNNGVVELKYFGPVGQPPWNAKANSSVPGPVSKHDLAGWAEGEALSPEDLELTSHQILHPRAGVDELELIYQHRRLPLQIAVQYFTWGDTGVLTRQLTLVNRGKGTIRIKSLPSLALELPAGDYDLTYLWGNWGHERQVATERLGAGRRSFVSTYGRSTRGYSPWFCLHHRGLGTRFLAQLAYSGNWEMSFESAPTRHVWQQLLAVSLGMRPDFGGPLALSPGESFAFPAVAFTATSGDLDEGANQLHSYQRQFVIARTPTNDPPLVQFNSWYPFPGNLTIDAMKRCADVAARLGAEVFVLDAGWFSGKNWNRELGDWTANRDAFPHGLEELGQYVKSRGMKFGIWVEIECLGVDSKMFQQHADWCLTYNGTPLLASDRYHLNFALPEVRQWARSVIDRFVREYGIAWLKIDYNLDIGGQFDPPGIMDRRGHVLYDHLMNYYHWLDELRAAYPKLVIENCSSGGTRFDLGIIAHTHTSWLSDMVEPRPSVQLAYGCTVEFIPEICNHWMVGDSQKANVSMAGPPGWWDFMFRVPMNGQFGISSRVFDWSDALVQDAAANVALYKRIRDMIVGADVYHLTAPPRHDDPTGWCAMQYVSPGKQRSLVMAYRLANSRENQVFKLRGLDPERMYRVTRDGAPTTEMSGEVLTTSGLRVDLLDEWRAQVVEIQEQ